VFWSTIRVLLSLGYLVFSFWSSTSLFLKTTISIVSLEFFGATRMERVEEIVLSKSLVKGSKRLNESIV
jgi:hypothetical protein